MGHGSNGSTPSPDVNAIYAIHSAEYFWLRPYALSVIEVGLLKIEIRV